MGSVIATVIGDASSRGKLVPILKQGGYQIMEVDNGGDLTFLIFMRSEWLEFKQGASFAENIIQAPTIALGPDDEARVDTLVYALSRCGADTYLTWSVSSVELLARIRVLMRRVAPQPVNSS